MAQRRNKNGSGSKGGGKKGGGKPRGKQGAPTRNPNRTRKPSKSGNRNMQSLLDQLDKM